MTACSVGKLLKSSVFQILTIGVMVIMYNHVKLLTMQFKNIYIFDTCCHENISGSATTEPEEGCLT